MTIRQEAWVVCLKPMKTPRSDAVSYKIEQRYQYCQYEGDEVPIFGTGRWVTPAELTRQLETELINATAKLKELGVEEFEPSTEVMEEPTTHEPTPWLMYGVIVVELILIVAHFSRL